MSERDRDRENRILGLEKQSRGTGSLNQRKAYIFKNWQIEYAGSLGHRE